MDDQERKQLARELWKVATAEAAAERAAARARVAEVKEQVHIRRTVSMVWSLICDLVMGAHELTFDNDADAAGWSLSMLTCYENGTMCSSTYAQSLCDYLLEIAERISTASRPDFTDVITTCRVLFAHVVALNTRAEQRWGNSWVDDMYAYDLRLSPYASPDPYL